MKWLCPHTHAHAHRNVFMAWPIQLALSTKFNQFWSDKGLSPELWNMSLTAYSKIFNSNNMSQQLKQRVAKWNKNANYKKRRKTLWKWKYKFVLTTSRIRNVHVFTELVHLTALPLCWILGQAQVEAQSELSTEPNDIWPIDDLWANKAKYLHN